MSDEPKTQTVHLSFISCLVIFNGIIWAICFHGLIAQMAPPGAIAVEKGAMYDLKGSNYTIHTYVLPTGERVYIYNEQISILPAGPVEKK